VLRIFRVDDSATARSALKAALQRRSEWVVVGEAYDGRHALDTFHHHMPHSTLMDFIMPELNGLEASRHLTERHPDVFILLVTTDPSKQLEIEARKIGIRGVCAKHEIHCLFTAIEALIAGRTYFSEEAAASPRSLRQMASQANMGRHDSTVTLYGE
jgi:DNA-binding NarL/FixJ family response regulator